MTRTTRLTHEIASTRGLLAMTFRCFRLSPEFHCALFPKQLQIFCTSQVKRFFGNAMSNYIERPFRVSGNERPFWLSGDVEPVKITICKQSFSHKTRQPVRILLAYCAFISVQILSHKRVACPRSWIYSSFSAISGDNFCMVLTQALIQIRQGGCIRRHIANMIMDAGVDFRF